MSTARKSNKNTGRIHPLTKAKVLAQYPHLPPTLLDALNKAMEYTTPREMGESLRRCFELAIFNGGAHDGLDKQDCNLLVDTNELIKAFLEHDREANEALLMAV